MDVKKVHYIQKKSQEVISLEAPIGDSEDDLSLSDFIKDEQELKPTSSRATPLKDKSRKYWTISPNGNGKYSRCACLEHNIPHTLEKKWEGFRRHP